MAKLPKSGGPHQPLQHIVRAFHGSVVFAETPQGIQVRAWPRKRGPGGTPGQLLSRANFKIMADAVNDMMDADRVTAMEIAEGTPWTWRDVLSRAVVGRLIELEGSTLVDIQIALDTISQIPGAILVRTVGGWAALLPDDDGLPLSLVDGMPAWAPIGSAGLEDTGVSPGSYTTADLTIGADGRITDASNGSGGGGGGIYIPYQTSMTSNQVFTPTPLTVTRVTQLRVTLPARSVARKCFASCALSTGPTFCRAYIMLDGTWLFTRSRPAADSDGFTTHMIPACQITIPGDSATHDIDIGIAAQGATTATTVLGTGAFISRMLVLDEP